MAELLESDDDETVLEDLGTAEMLRCRIRYFTGGGVIGCRAFVNEEFANAPERFGAKWKAGVRKIRGADVAATVRFRGSKIS